MDTDFNTLILWLIRSGYLLIILISVVNAFRSESNESEEFNEKRLKWGITAIIVIFIAIISLFNLNARLTEILREYALNEGWHSDRRFYQLLFVSGFISLGAVIILFFHSSSGIAQYNRKIIYGISFLGGILIIDTVSFHSVDQFFNHVIFGCSVRHILELCGIVYTSAFLIIKKYQGRNRHSLSGQDRGVRFV